MSAAWLAPAAGLMERQTCLRDTAVIKMLGRSLKDEAAISGSQLHERNNKQEKKTWNTQDLENLLVNTNYSSSFYFSAFELQSWSFVNKLREYQPRAAVWAAQGMQGPPELCPGARHNPAGDLRTDISPLCPSLAEPCDGFQLLGKLQGWHDGCKEPLGCKSKLFFTGVGGGGEIITLIWPPFPALLQSRLWVHALAQPPTSSII